MPRFFLVREKISHAASSINLPPEEIHHLRVMKLKPGDIIYISDGAGSKYKGEITEIAQSKATVKITSKVASAKGVSLKIILGQAIARFKKVEFILQKAAELGIYNITPIRTERSFLSRGIDINQNRFKRWERIVTEAAKQSGRADLPILSKPEDLDTFLEKSYDTDIKLCFWEDERDNKMGLKHILSPLRKPAGISILIGPEGGFSPREIEKIRSAGYITLLCGPRIMRVETAAITSIAICQYEWGDFSE